MIYPIGRMIAIKVLTKEELAELHGKEDGRGFAFPFSNIKSLFYNTLKDTTLPTDGYSDAEVFELNKQIFSCMPRPKIFGLDAPTMCEMDFVHEWDKNIYHNKKIEKTKDEMESIQ